MKKTIFAILGKFLSKTPISFKLFCFNCFQGNTFLGGEIVCKIPEADRTPETCPLIPKED